MRGDNVTGPDTVRRWAAFDRLPKAVRHALAHCDYEFDPVGVLSVKRKGKYSAEQMVRMIERNAQTIRNERALR